MQHGDTVRNKHTGNIGQIADIQQGMVEVLLFNSHVREWWANSEVQSLILKPVNTDHEGNEKITNLGQTDPFEALKAQAATVFGIDNISEV